MSPFCPELQLAYCTSWQADSLRLAVARRASAGESAERIEASLIDEYGSAIRAAPQRRGFGLVAWIAPVVMMIAGAFFAVRWIRRAERATRLARENQVAIRSSADPTMSHIPATTLARLAMLVRDE